MKQNYWFYKKKQMDKSHCQGDALSLPRVATGSSVISHTAQLQDKWKCQGINMCSSPMLQEYYYHKQTATSLGASGLLKHPSSALTDTF